MQESLPTPELERDRTEYVQLLERQKDWHRRHHESRVEIVEFTCGKCGAPHRVLAGAALDGETVTCAVCNSTIRLSVQIDNSGSK